jgi:hypothetical protein
MGERISPVLYFRLRANVIRDLAQTTSDRTMARRLRGAAADLDQAAEKLELYEPQNSRRARRLQC